MFHLEEGNSHLPRHCLMSRGIIKPQCLNAKPPQCLNAKPPQCLLQRERAGFASTQDARG